MWRPSVILRSFPDDRLGSPAAGDGRFPLCARRRHPRGVEEHGGAAHEAAQYAAVGGRGARPLGGRLGHQAGAPIAEGRPAVLQRDAQRQDHLQHPQPRRVRARDRHRRVQRRAERRGVPNEAQRLRAGHAGEHEEAEELHEADRVSAGAAVRAGAANRWPTDEGDAEVLSGVEDAEREAARLQGAVLLTR